VIFIDSDGDETHSFAKYANEWGTRQRFLLVFLTLLTALGQAVAQDAFTTFIGKSSCSPELSGHVGVYGIRLDKTQKSYLSAHRLNDKSILMIVQYAIDGDRCGTIKDVIQSRDVGNYFEFECEDHRVPSAVVVGTWPSKNNATRGAAVEAWRIDLAGLKFVPAKNQVTCIRRGGEDSEDEGDDLATWAKERAAKKHTKSPAR
jgi:hypothetical protein